MGDITSLVASLAGVSELVSLIVGERDRQKLAALQSQLTEKIIAAQAQLSQVLGTVIEQQRLIPVLEQRIRELEGKAAEKHRYELAKVGSVGEFFAYRLRAVPEGDQGVGEIDHFLCQPCFEVDKKAVLTGNGSGYWACPSCKHGAQTEPVGSRAMIFSTEDSGTRGF